MSVEFVFISLGGLGLFFVHSERAVNVLESYLHLHTLALLSENHNKLKKSFS